MKRRNPQVAASGAMRALPGGSSIYLWQPLGDLCAGITLFQNGVFESLGRAEPDNRLRLDLDCFAGSWVASHARLAVRFHCATQSGNDKLAGALCFFHGELE